MMVITKGSIVKLKGRKYKVNVVQTIRGKVYPKEIQSIGSQGRLDSYVHKDISEAWAEHPWEVVEGGIPDDPKARIIAKIKYLDEKFKVAQEKKKAALKATVSLKEMATTYTASSVSLTTSGLHGTIASNPAAPLRTTPMTYNEFMEYYNSIRDRHIIQTPF